LSDHTVIVLRFDAITAYNCNLDMLYWVDAPYIGNIGICCISGTETNTPYICNIDMLRLRFYEREREREREREHSNQAYNKSCMLYDQ
jgi:hypothetical protein